MSNHAVYRALTRLYPRDFRDRYRDDLIQHHADLTGDRGRSAAWLRTGLDLLVTLPRYRLETIMSERHADNALTVTVVVLTIAGATAVPTIGLLVGAAFLGTAALIAVTQRTRIALAVRTTETDRRHRRFVAAGLLGAATVAVVLVASGDLGGDSHWDNNRLVAYNLAFFVCALGAVFCLVAALLTPSVAPGRSQDGDA